MPIFKRAEPPFQATSPEVPAGDAAPEDTNARRAHLLTHLLSGAELAGDDARPGRPEEKNETNPPRFARAADEDA